MFEATTFQCGLGNQLDVGMYELEFTLKETPSQPLQVPNSKRAPPGKVSQQSTFDRGKSETIEVLKKY